MGIGKQQAVEENHAEPQQQTLMPTIVRRDEPQYQSVIELGEKLDHDRSVCNIALTGPYGSGKSSVLYTLQQDYRHHHYLQISLATLESYDISEDDVKKKENIEQLNRQIEYSILQQLIYREKYATVPNSRIKRIFHFEKWDLYKWTSGIIGFFIAYLIAFEPDWLRVDALYGIFDWGPTANSVFDILSVIYMIAGLFICVRKILLTYCGYQLSKFNLKNGEIELKEASIFNKHLDEIIYFFQRTDYDVVIIEDLDRFNTADIYLKLRELNQLINDSKEIDRHIVFIYAVKDDVFKDTQRAKFFDYISTVIPVINPSNSKDKLKHELQIRGYKDIADEDLEEMAFFINDMRLLRNIANEYQQYRKRLCATGQISLNPTKLLGMIVYKNYFPRDFAQLHNREGKIYQCIVAKSLFVTYARKELDERKSALEQKIAECNAQAHLTKKDLRIQCAYQILRKMPHRPISVLLDKKQPSFDTIVDREDLFEKMISSDMINYIYYNSYQRDNQNNDFDVKNSQLNFQQIYWSRKRALEDLPKEIVLEQKNITDEERRIKSLRLEQLFAKYDLNQCEDFTKIHLDPLMNVFLRRGYIDEDYYDYISYFYPDIVTLNDRELLLAMKQSIKSDYQANIDKVENFVRKIPLYVFNNDAVLNNILTDFLIFHSHNEGFREKFELLMKRIERADAPLDFIAQYYLNGKQAKTLFERFISWNSAQNWTAIMAHTDESERVVLIEGWLRFCKAAELLDEQKNWLDGNFDFLSEHIKQIGLEQAKLLSGSRKYRHLNTISTDLLTFVIANRCYALNRENLCFIVNYLNKTDTVNAENINLKRIRATANETVISYVEENLARCLKEFSPTDKNEDEESLLSILNDNTIDPEEKKNYLREQQCRVPNIESIADEAKDMAAELFLFEPLWENVAIYFSFSKKQVTETLKYYIEHFKFELKNQTCEVKMKDSLFDALMFSNILEMDTYKSIANSFDYSITNEDSLATLESDRLDFLIDAGMIAYTEENTVTLSSCKIPTLAKYLIFHKTDYLKEIDCITYSAELALYLFKSGVFNDKEKSRIVPLLSPDIINGNHALATEICSLLMSETIDLDDKSILAIISNSENIGERVSVVAHTIENNSGRTNFIEALLLRLKSPYAIIAEHDRRRPLIAKTDYNIRLLNVLKDVGYISSYKETDKELRIHKKVM